MGLHVVTGPATAGKSGILYAELERASREGSPVLALPAAPDVHRATSEFAAKRISGIRVTQLDRWIQSLWRLHGDGRRIVSGVERQLILSDVIRTMRSQGRLSSIADTPGLARLIGELVRTVPVGSGLPGGGSHAQVAAVCEHYWQELATLGLLESTEATRILSAAPPGGLGRVALNRFTDLSASQEAFIVGLAGVADVTIALTWQEGLPSTEALDPLVFRLLSAAAEHTVVPAGEWSDPALDDLANGLYRGVTLPPPGDRVELLEAAGAGAECAGVAMRVRTLIDDGLEPGRIAVVAKDMLPRAELLWAALQSHGVSADVDVAVPLSLTGFGAALLGLLRGVSDPEASRESLMAFVLSPYSGVDADGAGDADRAWRAARLRGPALLAAARRVSGMVETVNLATRIASETSDSGQWALCWHRLGSLLLANADHRRGLGGIVGRLDAAAHRTLAQTTDEMARGATTPSMPDVIAALDRAEVVTGASDERAVQVTEAHRVRGRRFEAVVLMGLTAAEFSSERPVSLSGVLLREFGENARPDERLSERMLFYTMVTRARRRLLLCRQASDDRGEAVRPSAFWDEVLDMYRRPDAPEGDLPVTVTRWSSGDIATVAPSFTPGRRQDREACSERSPQHTRGLLVDPEALTRALDDHEYSASEIESYLACPYRWFVQRALRPRAIDTVFDARERGTHAHGLLSAFYKTWAEKGNGRIEPESVDEALAVLSAVERAFESTASTKALGTAEEVAVAKAARWARAVVVDDATFLPSFEPAGHELPFGTAHGAAFEFGGVRLAGRIDRVDVGDAGVIAIDYKSASAVKGVGSFASHGLIQPTVYAVAAARLLGVPAIGGVYRSMRSLSARGFWREGIVDLGGRGKPADGLDADAFDAEVGRAAQAVASAVEGIRAGHIAAEPARKSACEHCLVRGVCERS